MSYEETTGTSPSAVQFQAGNALQADAFYVRRPADHELFKLLSEGHYCHVLAPRQTGKTSLVLRVASRLKDAGAKVARVDLSFLGSAATFEQWLWGIAMEIARQLGADNELEAAWDRDPKAALTARFGRFFTDVLTQISASCSVVVFFDELDALIERLNVDPARHAETSDFFSVLGSLHDQRARDPRLARLTFCFSGVAVPDDVAKGTSQSPFLVSRAIELNDFTREDLRVLETHLCSGGTNASTGSLSRASEMQDEIWRWTAGHPYMVQHLCHEISTTGLCASDKSPREVVSLAVDRRFLGPRRHDDVVMAFVRSYFREAKRDLPLTKMLYVYRRLLAKENVSFERGDDAHLRLLISGLVSARADGPALRLEIRNRILREVFDDHWLAERESEIFIGTSAFQWLSAPEALREYRVLRGKELASASAWMKSRHNVPPQLRDFIDASIEVENRETEERLRRDLRDKEREIDYERGLRREAEKRRKSEEKARRNKYVAWIVGAGLAATSSVTVILSYYSAQISDQTEKLTQRTIALEKTTQEKLTQGQLFQSVLRLREDARNASRRTVVDAGSEGPAPTEALLGQALKLAQKTADASAVPSEVQSVALESLILLTQSSLVVARGPKLAGDASVVALSPDSKLVLSAGNEGAALWDWQGRRTVATRTDGSFSAAAFFPDGGKVVLGGETGVLAAIEPKEGKFVETPLSPHGRRVSGIRVLPLGEIFSSGEDGLVQLQRIGGQRRVLLPPGSKAEAIEVTPDGSFLAAGTEDGVIHLWSSAGERKGELSGHEGSVYGLTFRPRTRPESAKPDEVPYMLLSASADKTARVWDAAAKKLICTAAGHTEAIGSVAFSPDGATFVTGGWDGTVRVWTTRTCQSRWMSAAASMTISTVAFVAGGTQVASASTDGFLRIFDANDGSLRSTLVGHGKALRGMAVSSDGALIVAGSMDGTARLWEAPSSRPLADLTRPLGEENDGSGRRGALSVVYSEDGKGLFVGYDSGFVRSWTAPEGWVSGKAPSVHAKKVHAGPVRKVLQLGSGREFVSAGADGKVLLWTDDGARLTSRDLTLAGPTPPTTPRKCAVLEKGLEGFFAAARTAIGRRFAVAGVDCLVRVWDSGSGELQLRPILAGHEHEVLGLSFSPSGALLASIDAAGTVIVWNVESGSQVTKLSTRQQEHPDDPDHFSEVRFLSEDRLLSGVKHETAKIWEIPSGKRLGGLEVPNHWVLFVDLSPPVSAAAPGRIFTASWDQSAALWDATTLGMTFRLQGHDGPVRRGLFSTDGRALWTASDDARLRFWDAETGVLMGEIGAGIGSLWDMALSPDGQFLAVAGERGSVRVFPATMSGFMSQACRLLQGRRSYDSVREVCSGR